MAEFSEHDIALLASAEVRSFLCEALKKKTDTLKAAEKLAKLYSPEDRKTILDYYGLLPKICEKFLGHEIQFSEFVRNPKFLICDTLAYEQSTASDLGIFKQTLWQGFEGEVDDLCCGMGGDSLYMPASLQVRGVDLAETRLAMYQENAKVLGIERSTICANVCDVETNAKYFTIDPARRASTSENQRDMTNLSPSFDEVLEIAKRYEGGMAKLPPAFPAALVPNDAELLYLGGHADCRESLVLFGSLARNPGTVRAVMVNKKGEAEAEWRGLLSEIQAVSNKDAEKDLPGCERSFRNATSESDLPVGELDAYLAEPAALLIRSHLFGNVALQAAPDAHLISEGIAYVTSSKPLPALAFANFKVIASCDIATSAVRNMLKEHDIGKLTLKLRGVKLDPDAEIKRLKPKGKQSAILFYTRAAGEKIAILAERM